MIKQISVFMENKVGMLSNFSKVIKGADLSIVAMCLADTTDFGVMRLVVNDPEKCIETLRENGFTASISNVLIVRMDHEGQNMADVFDVLAEYGITVEYMYSMAHNFSKDIAVIFKVDRIDHAVNVLTQQGMKLVTEEELVAL